MLVGGPAARSFGPGLGTDVRRARSDDRSAVAAGPRQRWGDPSHAELRAGCQGEPGAARRTDATPSLGRRAGPRAAAAFDPPAATRGLSAPDRSEPVRRA